MTKKILQNNSRIKNTIPNRNESSRTFSIATIQGQSLIFLSTLLSLLLIINLFCLFVKQVLPTTYVEVVTAKVAYNYNSIKISHTNIFYIYYLYIKQKYWFSIFLILQIIEICRFVEENSISTFLSISNTRIDNIRLFRKGI